MNVNHQAPYCRCGTRLARDNASSQCAACLNKARDLVTRPPAVPPEFWENTRIRDALDSWHMGRVIAAYRNHPFHGRALRQEIVAGWVGITQAQLSRIENGSPMTDLGKLCQWARILGVPASLLWFKLPQSREPRAYDPGSPASNEDLAPAIADPSRQRYAEIDDMNRRELLRLLAIAGAALATPHIIDQVDWDRVDHAARTARLDAATADEYATLNAQLWQIFATSQAKSVAFPLVRSQLGVLTNGLQQARGSAMRQRLCGLVADLFQLAGEISFDANRYTDAAHCYTLAATASKEAGAFDLWACAMTRHAFIGVYERQFREVLPMLILAADLAQNGDRSLSTRHWVSTVQAHTFAGLGDLDACQKSLDDAENVRDLTGQVHNSGWLRFEGSRLAEERGTCYVELGLPDLAETALNDALRQNLSARRRGSVLTDLAMTGVQRRDPDRILTYATSALDTAQHTGSGVIGRKLQGLQTHLAPFLDNSRVRHLNTQITNHISASIA